MPFEKYCKLFETESHGQILCVLKELNDMPAIFFHCQPKGFGVCHDKVTYPESMDFDEAWSKANELLENLTEDEAIAFVQPIFDAVAQMGGGNA